MSDLEQQANELFREAPIKFRAKKGNKLEEGIQKIIKLDKITIPVIHIRGQIYLIGTARCTCELKIDSILVRIGGGTK